MHATHLAVILLSQPEGEGYNLLLKNKVAGLSPLKRLLLALQRSGVENFLVLSKDLDEQKLALYREDIEKDTRFQSTMHWHDRDHFFSNNSIEQGKTFTASQPFLVVNGNLVTHQKVIQRFLENAQKNNCDQIYSLTIDAKEVDSLVLLPPIRFSDLHRLHEYKTKPIELSGETNFCIAVTNRATAKVAEKEILLYNRHHYHQFMDKYFNSKFSRPLSAMLARTAVTPNTLSIFGLFIGMLSGWCFAQGDYFIGLAGGFLLVLTAIWDCCDGDVARLTFKESDFGEQLDTACDNIINVFAFTGIMLGVSKNAGLAQALTPFIMLALGGGLIFAFIYFPKGGKGNSYKDSGMYDVIQELASRNFIYVILLFSVLGHLDWFLWLAGFGSIIFALGLFVSRYPIFNKPHKG
jgi:phosphatidylglycerophosphate synthase